MILNKRNGFLQFYFLATIVLSLVLYAKGKNTACHNLHRQHHKLLTIDIFGIFFRHRFLHKGANIFFWRYSFKSNFTNLITASHREERRSWSTSAVLLIAQPNIKSYKKLYELKYSEHLVFRNHTLQWFHSKR